MVGMVYSRPGILEHNVLKLLRLSAFQTNVSAIQEAVSHVDRR